MRIDKFLKDSRLIKRRTVAADACDNGRVLVNDMETKPGNRISIGDIIEIEFGQYTRKVKIIKLMNNPRKHEAPLMYEEIN